MFTLKGCSIFRVDSELSNKEIAERLGAELHFDSDRVFMVESRAVGGRVNPDMIAITDANPKMIAKAEELGKKLGERDKITIS